MLANIPEWINSFNLNSNLFSNVFLSFVIIGLVSTLFFERQRAWLFFPIWGIVYFLAYAIINPSTYPWYALHIYFILEVMAGIGVGWMIETTFKFNGAKRVTIGLATGLLTLWLLISNLQRGFNSVETFPGDSRAPTYMAIADWLNHNTRPEESVAYLEIGYLGYYTENRIIDLAGLIDPLIASNIAEHGFTWGFWHYQPKYFVFNPGMDSEVYLARIREAANEYQEVARFPGGPDGLPIVLFRRIEIHTPSPEAN